MSSSLEQVVIDENDKRVLQNAAEQFIARFEKDRHKEHYTLQHTMMSFDPKTQTYIDDDSQWGPYASAIQKIAELLENQEYKNNFGMDISYLQEQEPYKKIGIDCIIESNWNEFLMIVNNALPFTLRDRLSTYITEQKLALEATDTYLQTATERFEKGVGIWPLELFLQKYNLEKKSLNGKGSYSFLQGRLQMRHGKLWKEQFIKLLPDDMAKRLITVTENGDIIGEACIRSLEATYDEFKECLSIFGVNNVDDIVLLLTTTKPSMVKKRNLGKYLGRCRKPQIDGELQYDWQAKFKETCEKMTDITFETNPLLSELLLRQARAHYRQQEMPLDVLTKELVHATGLYAQVLDRVYTHIQLTEELRMVQGFAKEL